MKIVRIIADWDYPNLLRQTPASKGVWDNIQFTLEPVKECDYLIVLNRTKEKIRVKCPSGNKWLLKQEPPIPSYEWHYNIYQHFDTVFTPGDCKIVPQQISSQTALPWHVDKDFDYLSHLACPTESEKFNQVSWITSNAASKPGHIARLKFKDFLEEQNFVIHLYGRDFNPIDDKFDGIFPFKYSIAVECSSGKDYWTEKLADCFLSWTMPIYAGCTNITEYFPVDSMILIDLNNPKKALDIIRTAIKEDWWSKNIRAIEAARNKILYGYQFFPFITKRIKERETKKTCTNKLAVTIPHNRAPSEPTIITRIPKKIWNFVK